MVQHKTVLPLLLCVLLGLQVTQSDGQEFVGLVPDVAVNASVALNDWTYFYYQAPGDFVPETLYFQIWSLKEGFWVGLYGNVNSLPSPTSRTDFRTRLDGGPDLDYLFRQGTAPKLRIQKPKQGATHYLGVLGAGCNVEPCGSATFQVRLVVEGYVGSAPSSNVPLGVGLGFGLPWLLAFLVLLFLVRQSQANEKGAFDLSAAVKGVHGTKLKAFGAVTFLIGIIFIAVGATEVDDALLAFGCIFLILPLLIFIYLTKPWNQCEFSLPSGDASHKTNTKFAGGAMTGPAGVRGQQPQTHPQALATSRVPSYHDIHAAASANQDVSVESLSALRDKAVISQAVRAGSFNGNVGGGDYPMVQQQYEEGGYDEPVLEDRPSSLTRRLSDVQAQQLRRLSSGTPQLPLPPPPTVGPRYSIDEQSPSASATQSPPPDEEGYYDGEGGGGGGGGGGGDGEEVDSHEIILVPSRGYARVSQSFVSQSEDVGQDDDDGDFSQLDQHEGQQSRRVSWRSGR